MMKKLDWAKVRIQIAPYCGSGTSLVVVKSLDCDFIDISKNYLASAKEIKKH